MQDRRELLDDEEEALRIALEGNQAGIWTALPGIVDSVNLDAQTVSVQPAIKGENLKPDGSTVYVNLPILVDVPICWPRAGGYALTFPIKKGDEALVIFSSRCIDAWWQSGGIQKSVDDRMHDLSDAFAILAPTSQPKKLPNVSADSVQLRDESGLTSVSIKPDGVVRVDAEEIESHARKSYHWDVYGYGQKVIHTGGANYRIENYVTGAVIDSVNLPINQPDAT
jgi:hypothetical protein